MRSHTTFTIVGAGIAGLATAAFLARQGFTVTVVEKRPSLPEEGAGIQLTPNAVHVLMHLDIANQLQDQAFLPHYLNVKSGVRGRSIVKMPFDGMEQTFGAPYLVLQRQTLLKALYDCGKESGAEIRFGQSFNFEKDDLRCDGLIAADGVWSSIRENAFHNKAEPTGRIAYRALLAGNAQSKREMSISLSPSRHFVQYPVNENGDTNLVALVKEPISGTTHRWSEAVDTEHVLKKFHDWNDDAKQLIAKGDWVRWPLFTVKPDSSWTKGNIALIGDAAHAMVPFLAQGGGAALEDAATLAHMIREHKDIPKAFKAYEIARKPRVTKIWQEAWRNGERYHWPLPLAQARDLGLKAMGGEKLLKRYSWIYEWRPPQTH